MTLHFNDFHKSALQALGWPIVGGAVQVSRRVTPSKFSRSKEGVGLTVPEGFYLNVKVERVAWDVVGLQGCPVGS